MEEELLNLKIIIKKLLSTITMQDRIMELDYIINNKKETLQYEKPKVWDNEDYRKRFYGYDDKIGEGTKLVNEINEYIIERNELSKTRNEILKEIKESV